MTSGLLTGLSLARTSKPNKRAIVYTPKHFSEEDPEILLALIEAHPLATIITQQTGHLQANHIPLLWSPLSQLLLGHIAKANSLWRGLQEDTQVLVIFQGPDGYVSPNWYPSKQKHGKVVPTWNYCTVHVHGQMRFVHESSWKLDFLNRLTDQHEQHQDPPWSVTDAPADYTKRLLEEIVGLEISVDSMKGKYKLSQNQSPVNYAGVVQGLQQQQSTEADRLLDMMRKKKRQQ